MRRGADADDGAAAVEIVLHHLPLCSLRLEKTYAQNQKLRVFQEMQARDVIQNGGIIKAGAGIDRKEHHTIETVPLGKQTRQHRRGFLRAVFQLGGDQHDQLAVARFLSVAGVTKPKLALLVRDGFRPVCR